MLDNCSVAILCAVNDLALRYGVAPCEFVASVQSNKAGQTVLTYETMPRPEASQDRFVTMLRSINLTESNTELVGDDSEVYRILQGAIARAPRVQSKRR